MQAGGQLNGALLFDHAVQAVVVDEQFAIEVEARTVVGVDEERVFAGFVDRNVSGEHQGECIASLQHGLIHYDCRGDTGA